MLRLPLGTKVALALPVVWFAQGSTFVALRVGVAEVPPFLLSGARFLLVGSVVLAFVGFRSGWKLDLTRRELGLGLLTGTGLFFACQGTASWGSQYLEPGVVAVLNSTIPLWAAIISRVTFGARFGMVGAAGLVAAFAGVIFLSAPHAGGGVPAWPALLVLAGSVCWAAAAVVVGRTGIGRRPLLTTGVQSLAGGSLQLVAAAILNETPRLHASSVFAVAPVFLYLVIVSSLLNGPLLNWLFANARMDVANSGSFIAPAVSLALGWLLLGIAVGPRTLLGVAVIVIGVAAIAWSATRAIGGGTAAARRRLELVEAA